MAYIVFGGTLNLAQSILIIVVSFVAFFGMYEENLTTGDLFAVDK